MEEILLERMTSPQVKKAIEAGFQTVVFACGATEQHGPHLPLFVDSEHGTRLSREVASRIGKALVAPTIRIGCSDHHLDFSGTISIKKATLESLLFDYCSCLKMHGFTKIFIIPSHAGNMAPIEEMLERLKEAIGSEVKIIAYTSVSGLLQIWKNVVDYECGFSEKVGGHADIAESSIMLVLHPDLVHVDKAEIGCLETPTPAFLERMFREGFSSVSPNGIMGDPTGMSTDIGKHCIESLSEMLASFFLEKDRS